MWACGYYASRVRGGYCDYSWQHKSRERGFIEGVVECFFDKAEVWQPGLKQDWVDYAKQWYGEEEFDYTASKDFFVD
eukprot:12043948-Prorocentrum_lima.AAC.1